MESFTVGWSHMEVCLTDLCQMESLVDGLESDGRLKDGLESDLV